jgi:DNA-binding NarL/FixJ family response regulator
MKSHRRIVLVGDSLLLDAVEASLADNGDLGVSRIHSTVNHTAERVLSLTPDLVIFDLNAPQLQYLVPLLMDFPDVRLIGLDVNSSKVVALSGQPYTTLTASDLTNVICEHTPRGNEPAAHLGTGPSQKSHVGAPALQFS